MTVSLGFIGLGKMGVSHLSIFAAHPDVRVGGIADPSAFMRPVVEKHLGFKTHKDYKKLIDSGDVEAVVVATPSRTHAEIATYAMERGLHVFVEKPLTLAVEDSQRLTDLAAAKGVANQVGYHNRFIATFRETKRLIDAGMLGAIYQIAGEAYGQVVIKQSGSTWRSQKVEGGGCLHDYCSHVVDLMNYLVGPPTDILGASLQSIYSSEVEDAVYATLGYPEGLTGQLSINWSDDTYRKMSTQITVLGTNGKIIVDRQECRVYLRESRQDETYPQGWTIRYITDLQEPVDFYLRGEEYSSQADAFVKAVQASEVHPLNSFASALQTDRVVDLLGKQPHRRIDPAQVKLAGPQSQRVAHST